MPFPIKKVKDQTGEYKESLGKDPSEAQELSTLIPMLNQPYSLLSQMVYGDKDKDKVKNIWLSSESKEDKSLVVSSSIPQKEIDELKSRGLAEEISGQKRHIMLTDRGMKLLNEAVLNSNSSFTKSASKKMVLKNSYDFGDEVLVRVNHPEKFGARYITLSKDKFAEKKAVPRTIEDYNVRTHNEDGSERKLSEYTDEELIKVLHLAKNIIKNKEKYILANNNINNVPVHRIRSFAETIVKELNSRWR